MRFIGQTKAILICFLGWVSGASWGDTITEDTRYRIGMPAYLESTFYQPQIEGYFARLYQGTGVSIHFQYLPLNNKYKMLTRNQLDAVAFMLPMENPDEENLVKLPEAITTISSFAGCLKDTHCEVDAQTRFVVVEDALFVNQLCRTYQLDCLFVDSIKLAHKAIADRLADAHLIQRSPHVLEPCLDELGMKLRPIANSGVPLYHYVDAKNAYLIDALSSNLKQLKEVYSAAVQRGCSEEMLSPVLLQEEQKLSHLASTKSGTTVKGAYRQ
ncbi:hypothetical protein DRW07_14120 [Alteromonas sediminis]|uniref:Solute-binding protein family 3/N-terminal domain-containing protein n=1 Tax=Alteromonas sediminis TaxID=2259342 RepID=A0A3N5XZ16_9ALTE|nr:hypothetical protein [Alteromonas sediminis]RPJ65940.1 hypothetical protein DRW07_14120 [Alteromonas sediminis]